MTLTLLAPMKGWIAPLAEVPDSVFAERMLGDGVAIDPLGSTLHAPCDADVVSVARTRHAVTLRAENGAEILIHIGLETVALGGEGFAAHVNTGQRVAAGDRLISFDLDLLARRAASLLTPVLVTNLDAFALTWRQQDCQAEVGERLMTLRPLATGDAAPNEAGNERRTSLKLGFPHGLHARPAGRVSALARTFGCEIAISANGRTANVKSPIALMTFGAAHGDNLDLVCRGEDADSALAALCAFLVGDGGETAAPAPLSASIVSAPTAAKVDGVLKGVGAAPGHAIGRAVQFSRTDIRVVETGAGVAAERAALTAALDTVRKQINASAHDAIGADIMTAHLAVLDDPDLKTEADASIAKGKSAAYAWAAALEAQVAVLRSLHDPRLKARASDLIDLKRQVLLALGGQAEAPADLPDGAILLADDLFPSELMALSGRILGLCTAAGGATSHVAIIAGALNIPLVAAAGAQVLKIAPGTPLILNAVAGTLRIDPNADEIAAARAFAARRTVGQAVNLAAASAPCRMADGARIEVFANLAGVAETAPAVAQGAEGCGLLRSEFLFMDRAAPPDEEEQRAAYQAIADALDGRPLIVRTLDIGGDKLVSYLPMPKEDNPALGLRGVRTSLWRPDLLRTQLRALLRVMPVGACKIMIPMVVGVHEISAVRAMLDETQRALGLAAPVALGVMIETPAAALTAGALAEVADFFSIGANDLTQYTLAMDRTNPMLAPEADALHPAVLRLIALTCEEARAKNRPVGVCGGVASDPLAAPLLIGLGVTELSATASVIPDLKAAIRPLTMTACRSLAETALRQTSAADVRAVLTAAAKRPLEAAQ